MMTAFERSDVLVYFNLGCEREREREAEGERRGGKISAGRREFFGYDLC